MVAIGDFHYGATWRVCGLYGEVINEYNPDVFEDRMGALLTQLIAILDREEIDHVDLLLCGDSLDGMLRASQLTKLRWGIVESCMRLSEYMAQWVASLAKYVHVSVYGVDGNHGEIRPLGSKHGEFENENMEKIILWYLHARLAPLENVEVDPVSDTTKTIEVQGYTVMLTHGTQAKTLESLAKQTILLYGKRVDIFICAHRHREQESVSGYTDDGNSLVMRIPSICGVDSYAQSLGYGGAPGALAMVMERGYGRRCVYPITLG